MEKISHVTRVPLELELDSNVTTFRSCMQLSTVYSNFLGLSCTVMVTLLEYSTCKCIRFIT